MSAGVKHRPRHPPAPRWRMGAKEAEGQVSIMGAAGARAFPRATGTRTTRPAVRSARPASPGPNSCLGDNDDIATGSQSNFLIPVNVLCALQNLGFPLTVDGLLQLANCALAGASTDVASIAEINQAVSAINEGFDGCRFLINHCDDVLECPPPLAPSGEAFTQPLFPFAPRANSASLLSWLNWDRYGSGRLAIFVDAEMNPTYLRLRL